MFGYSVVVPVYNRPLELDELLHSLTLQSRQPLEVIVIDDGSDQKCDHVCEKYKSKLPIRYYFKANEGQGFTRNFGFSKATGDYFVVFDSDCIIPSDYFEIVDRQLSTQPLDAFGGPDAAHESFSPLQKAISYSMTSFFTTGGIRGRKKHLGQFHPRSFNMGISRDVWKQTGGYIITRMGEDIEFSIRIQRLGFKIGLIPEAVVYHKRRTSLTQFYKQLHFFGRARINIFRFFREELRLVHLFPLIFTLGLLCLPLLFFVSKSFFTLAIAVLISYAMLLFGDALIKTKSIVVSILGVAASFTQLTAYGVGFATELLRYFRQPEPSGLRKSSLH